MALGMAEWGRSPQRASAGKEGEEVGSEIAALESSRRGKSWTRRCWNVVKNYPSVLMASRIGINSGALLEFGKAELGAAGKRRNSGLQGQTGWFQDVKFFFLILGSYK